MPPTEIPIPPQPPPQGWKPTASTGFSGVAGAATVVIITICDHYKLTIDSVTASAITTLVAAVVGYLVPDGGRK